VVYRLNFSASDTYLEFPIEYVLFGRVRAAYIKTSFGVVLGRILVNTVLVFTFL